MALRMVLVGVVASLGLTPPDAGDVAAWQRSARSWFDAHLAAWDAPAPATPTAPAVSLADPAASTPLISDEAFAAVLDDVVATFQLADGPVQADDAERALVAARAPRFEPLEVSDAFASDLASVLNREAEGLVPPAPAPEPEPTALVVADDELYRGVAYDLNRQAEGLEPAASLAPPRAATPDGLSRAFRLTREAAGAWISLLQAPAVVTIAR